MATASVIAGRAPAARATEAAPRLAWTLTAPETRYLVRLAGPAVAVDCYDASQSGDGESGALDLPADAAIVALGPERMPIAWELIAAQYPDPRTLKLTLAAIDQALLAELLFEIDAATGILSRATMVRHLGNGPPVNVVATLSFWCELHEPVEAVRYLSGSWARETQVQRGTGDNGLRLESRAGKTGFDFQPYVALRSGSSTSICEILWSGNWIMQVHPTQVGARVSGGLNDWRFHHRLRPDGPSLRLPTVLFGRFKGGLNAATQRLHDYRRAHRPDPDRPIPVQFNSWYPYSGDPTAASMLPLVPLARQIGCEAFVVDAGWYSTDGSDTAAEWEARTGDWRTSRRRFPNGLREVSEACREHGLRFGLWFEPEVIGRLSAIRTEHPEWLHHVDGRPPAPDERAVLNLGVPAARRHVFERVTRILSAVGVRWMKWDFNADLGAGGWAPGLPESLTDQDPLVAHYEALYRLQDAIRRWFPDLILEMCASGGGRMDGELLEHAHVNWISDWPGALRKLAIHVGTQLAHPAVVCNDWLVEWPPHSIAGYEAEETTGIDERGDLAFRLRVAMLGSFGISARIDRWPEEDFALAARHVALYREKLRPIIHHGDQYLLTPAPPADGNGDWAALWYVMKDGSRGVLFAFRLAGTAMQRAFPLPGLRDDRRYRAIPFSGAAAQASGGDLAAGCTVTLAERFQSELCLVEVV